MRFWSQCLREKTYASISRRSVPDRLAHDGDSDVLGYVLDGGRYVKWGPSEGERALAWVGEFFHILAGLSTAT